ncbi:MAG: response regulator transcription factor [Bacteroidales bacterium]|nr:response regulator transcription factor [Bacteroidales bacterium]
MINILIIDDDPLVASSLKTILSADKALSIRGIGFSGEEAISLYDRLRPDVLLMDIRMKKLSGIESAQKILSRHPEARILFLTTFSDDEYIIAALKMGAKGYILKQNYESISPAVKAVSMGQRVFGDSIIDRLPQLMQNRSAPSATAFGLSEKEFNILSRVADGLTNREIGEAMGLGEGTVRNYISLILEKLELRDRTQLAILYHRYDASSSRSPQ